MDDLISRKDAIDALDAIESEVADGEGFRYAKWREYFENLPSAQPEIIHCKDCKHGELFSDQYLCRKAVFWREGDFYCGYAERREDG